MTYSWDHWNTQAFSPRQGGDPWKGHSLCIPVLCCIEWTIINTIVYKQGTFLKERKQAFD